VSTDTYTLHQKKRPAVGSLHLEMEFSIHLRDFAGFLVFTGGQGIPVQYRFEPSDGITFTVHIV
jgi:hypothetical protein